MNLKHLRLITSVVSCVLLFACNGTSPISVATNSSVSTASSNSSSSLTISYGTFTDSRDGQAYKTIAAGTQEWMAQNMNYATSSGSYCYNDSIANCKTFGRLYIWDSANSVCPVGWHLPSDSQWIALEEYIGMDSISASLGGYRGKNQGTMLKLNSKLWFDNTDSGTNNIGFSGLPSGEYEYQQYIEENCYALFWTSSSTDSSNAWVRQLICADSRILRIDDPKSWGLSVRCIKN